MKRLLLFLCVISLAFKIFTQEVTPEQIKEMSTEVQAKKDELTKKQQELEQQITKQKEIVDQAPPQEQKEESNTLQALQIANSRAKMSITSLSDYLDKVAEKNVTQEDQAVAKDEIASADNVIKIIDELKTEFVPSEPAQEETEQEAQAQIEQLSWWNTFKLNIQSVLTQAKATLASFFGNKDAVMAAHKDLIDIYNQLKDYTSKAKSAGKLAGFYIDAEEFSKAIQMQATQLDALNNPNIDLLEKYPLVRDIMTDFLSLKRRIYAERPQLTPQDNEIMDNVEKEINDFLGITGYKINKISAYQVLGDLEPNATVDQIKSNYERYVELYTPTANDSPEMQQKLKQKLAELKNAITDLLGTNINDPNLALVAKEAYDKSPIVQQGIEVRKMTPEEKAAFDAQKKEQETQGQTRILGG